MKYCGRCKEERDLSLFCKDKRQSDGISAWCKTCRYSYTVQWRIDNPERGKIHDQKKKFSRYGLTQEMYNESLANQGFSCAICGSTYPGRKGDFSVDHDHRCCKSLHACDRCRRGLLCNDCNHILGLAKDSVDVLIAAAEYLQKHDNYFQNYLVGKDEIE